MCQTIIFHYQHKIYRVSYRDLEAKLPVLMSTGELLLLPWGRHKFISSQLPIGGFASLDEIYAGKWDEFFPKPVKLPIKAFLVADIYQQTRWFHLPTDKWIQGLVARFAQELRVYMVTLTPNEMSLYPHWPRVHLGQRL